MMQCCKEDCYWYDEWQDMNAHIPYCKCKNADFIEPKDCENCEQYHSKYKPTNADRIRQMTDEELAEYLEEVELAAVRAYSNDDLLLKGELSKWWLKRLKKEAKT